MRTLFDQPFSKLCATAKIYNFSSEPGIVTGTENNQDLFIRKTIFPKGYAELDYHNHPNSYEFYLVFKGRIRFESESKEIVDATGSSIVYFQEGEPHRIVSVSEDVDMLLIKRLRASKS